jgi:4-hydroxybenzoate polyprenyltransferase
VQLKPLVRLARPALAPTAAADVVAGAWFAGGDVRPFPLAAAAAAGTLLYMGGMVLNDLCDVRVDRVREPQRPLVVDPGLVPRARWFAVALFGAGLVLGAALGLFLHALAVAALAASYDLGLKRVFPADALTIGAARAANLSFGLAAGGYGPGGPALLYVLGYLAFIASVSAMSRAEDLDPPPTRRLALCLAGLPLLLAYGALAGAAKSLAPLLPAPLHLLALGLAVRSGTRPAAKKLVFRSLLLIYAVHASVLGLGRAGGLAALLCCAAATFFILSPGRSGPSGPSPSPAPGTSAGGSGAASGTSPPSG